MPKITRHGGPSYDGHADISADHETVPEWVPVDQAATETPDEPETAPRPRARTTRRRSAK